MKKIETFRKRLRNPRRRERGRGGRRAQIPNTRRGRRRKEGRKKGEKIEDEKANKQA